MSLVYASDDDFRQSSNWEHSEMLYFFDSYQKYWQLLKVLTYVTLAVTFHSAHFWHYQIYYSLQPLSVDSGILNILAIVTFVTFDICYFWQRCIWTVCYFWQPVDLTATRFPFDFKMGSNVKEIRIWSWFYKIQFQFFLASSGTLENVTQFLMAAISFSRWHTKVKPIFLDGFG